MAQISPQLSSLFIVFLLSTITTPSASLSTYSSYKNLFSLSHSLLTRVSNLRASRGDISGAHRASALAQRLEKGMGLGFWKMTWTLGWDYVRNYAWRDFDWRDFDWRDLYDVVSGLSELAGYLADVAGLRSEGEKTAWLQNNYGKGVLKVVIETVEKEVVDGELLKDCIEIGSNDLKGLVLIIKDLASQYFSTSHHNGDL